MRPDRIIVGEVRGAEALDMLQAMNTGHEGSLSTLHANSPRDALARLETMVLMAGMDLPMRAIREQVASALDLIVQLSRLRDGTRKVVDIAEVVGMEGDTITMQSIYTFDFAAGFDAEGYYAGGLKPTGIRPMFSEELGFMGVELPESLLEAGYQQLCRMVVAEVRRIALVLAALGLALALPGVAEAQAPAESIQVLSTTVRDDGTVEMVVAIPPAYGEVPALPQFFGVTESGESRTAAVTDLQSSVDIVVAIDTSGSMRGQAITVARVPRPRLFPSFPPMPASESSDLARPDGFRRTRHRPRNPVGHDHRTRRCRRDVALGRPDHLGVPSRSEPKRVSLCRDPFGRRRHGVRLRPGLCDHRTAGRGSNYLRRRPSDQRILRRRPERDGRASWRPIPRHDRRRRPRTALPGDRRSITSRYLIEFTPSGSGEQLVIVSVAAADGSLATAQTTIDLGAAPATGTPLALSTAEIPAELGAVAAADPGLFGNRWIYFAGIAAMFGALICVASLLSIPNVRSLDIRALSPSDAGRAFSNLNQRLSRSVDSMIKDRDDTESFDLTLDSAGLDIRPGSSSCCSRWRCGRWTVRIAVRRFVHRCGLLGRLGNRSARVREFPHGA